MRMLTIIWGSPWQRCRASAKRPSPNFRTALRIEPTFAEAHLNLGNAYSQMPGRLPDAITEYQAALRTRPDLLEAHSNLGNAFSRMPGRQTDAIAEYRAALRIDPDSATVHFNLGNVFQTMGRLDGRARGVSSSAASRSRCRGGPL